MWGAYDLSRELKMEVATTDVPNCLGNHQNLIYLNAPIMLEVYLKKIIEEKSMSLA